MEYHLRSENDEIGMDDELDDVPDIPMEEEEEPVPTNERPFRNGQEPASFVNPEFYLGKPRRNRWYLEPQAAQTSRTPKHNIIPVFNRPRSQGNAKNANDPESAFRCIIDDEIIAKTVEYTNIYIDRVRPQ